MLKQTHVKAQGSSRPAAPLYVDSTVRNKVQYVQKLSYLSSSLELYTHARPLPYVRCAVRRAPICVGPSS